MTEADLLPLLLDVNQDIDNQFQFWLSITFAVLVASFVADERLSRFERKVIAALYLCAATILLLRYQVAIGYYGDVLALFAANGIERPSGLLAALAALLRLALFTIGSLVAAASVVFPHAQRTNAR